MASSRNALLIGASGLVGGYCLRGLAENHSYKHIHLLVRRRIEIPDNLDHAKITQHIAPLDNMAQYRSAFGVQDVFCTLGTTIRIAGTQEAFRKVDYEYVVSAARLAAQHNATQMLVVSALSASAHSSVFYSRTKGEMERDVQQSGIAHSCMFRPSFIEGNRAESRIGEHIGIAFTKFVAPLLVGALRKYRVIHAQTIARAMIGHALSETTGHHVMESDAIERLGKAFR
jgi:uncharacterized protein YbjT (DUF2867 family)